MLYGQRYMFWNLVTSGYEKYNLHHGLYFMMLLIYSLLGGLMFHWIEGAHEDNTLQAKNTEMVRNSVAAKRFLVESVQQIYFNGRNASSFYETKLRIALDAYDRQMGIKPERLKEKRWTIWGGLYYAGTIYTTIGYGDMAATTFWGRILTMVYAMIGIPMVITILNDWGTLLFNLIEKIWKRFGVGSYKKMLGCCKKKESPSELDLLEECGSEKFEHGAEEKGEKEEKEPIPLIIVVIVLVFWIGLCCSIFSFFEQWTFFEAIYFFFISLTTIGFGDITPSHKVAVANFLFILMGLSVVSMSINIIQMNLELIFQKIVASIDSDFKHSLEEGVGDDRRTNPDDDQQKKGMENGDGDILKEYGKNIHGTQKLLMRFMSNHQKEMLNQKFEDRAKMRNKFTQTLRQIKTTSVQTQDKHYEDYCEYTEEEPPKMNSAIATKRLYIYNTGFE